MKKPASLWSRCPCGAVMVLLASASGLWAGEPLLDEHFADGDRTTRNVPASAAWFLHASSRAYSESVAPEAWILQTPPAPSRLGLLTHLPAASSLRPGEALTLTVTFQAGEPAGDWSVGLFDSRGARLSADTIGRVGTGWRGFAGRSFPAQSAVLLTGRLGAGEDLWSNGAFRTLGAADRPAATGSNSTASLHISRLSRNEWAITLEVDGQRFSAPCDQGPDVFDTVAIQLEGTTGPATISRVSLQKETGLASEGPLAVADGAGESGRIAALRALPTGSRWYLQSSHAAPSQDWNTLATWFSATAGGGSHPVAIASTDVFDLNRRRAISPAITSGTTAFAGGALVMGVSSTLSMLGANATSTVIPLLAASGGIVTNSGGSLQNLTITELEASGGALTLSTGAAGRTLVVTSSTLTGSGTLVFGGAGRHQLQVANAHHFSGELTFSTGTMTFLNNLSTSGSLVVRDTYRINLTRAISCAGLTISGAAVAPQPGDAPGSYRFQPGTYSYATLNAMYPGIFVSGSTGGSITVRTGTTYYLKVAQAQGRNWTSTCASDWNTQPNGGGANAPAVGPLDDYSTNGRLLRTPVVSHTFGGRTLLLQNGSIALKNPRPEIATVPTLVATSGTIMQYLNTSGTGSLKVNFFTQNSGTTHLVATAGQTLDLNVDYLSGNGNLRFASAGECQWTVTDASQFSGTYTQASGTLRLSPITSGPVHAVGAPLAMKGRLVVEAGAAVVLNRNVYAGGLTVGGIARPNGTYTASSLGFSGSASITVYPPDLSTPAALFGVNIACGTFAAGGALMPTNPVYWDYYDSKGLTLIRVPFLWQHVQPTLNGPLNSSMMGKFDTILSLADARGMKVIFDMHNYGCFSSTTQIIGTAAVPHAAYQDVWSKISAHLANSPHKAALYGYDIMNEPVRLGRGDNWPIAAKSAIAGIRANDMTTYIIAEGRDYAGAQSWNALNEDLGFIDPACRLIYSAHSYWGKNHNDLYLPYSGSGGENGYDNMGVDQLRRFVDWIKKRKFRGFVGEYGVPTNVPNPDARWHTVLDRALNYLQANDVSGTYWSGGPGWEADYELLSDVFLPPGPNLDAPAMSVLQNYGQ